MMPTGRYGQNPLGNWHFNTPYPRSGPMSRTERDFWFKLVLDGAFMPSGPKAPVQQRRLAPPPLAIAGPRVEQLRS